jgi:hypothetical protein
VSDLIEFYQATKVIRDNSALRLRLGDIKIEHRPIDAELREAMQNRIAEADGARSRKRRRARKG